MLELQRDFWAGYCTVCKNVCTYTTPYRRGAPRLYNPPRTYSIPFIMPSTNPISSSVSPYFLYS